MKKKEQKILNAEIRLKIRKGELPYTFVDKDEDLYAPFLNSVNWQRGAGGYDTIDR